MTSNKRQKKVSILSHSFMALLLISVYLLFQSVAEAETKPVAEHKEGKRISNKQEESKQDETKIVQRDPYIERILKELSERMPNPGDLLELSKYSQAHPDDSGSHLALAHAYNKLGMDGLYADELSKAWLLSPDSTLYLLAALKARAITGDEQNFNALVEQALRTFKDEPKKLFSLGKLFQSNEQIDLSIRFFNRALETSPEDNQIRLAYCNALLAKKRYYDLLTEVEPLIKDQDCRYLATFLKGLALFNLNRTRESLIYLKAAYQENHKRAEVAEAYFDALMSDGESKQALEPAFFSLALQDTGSTHINTVKTKIRTCVASSSAAQLELELKKIQAFLPPGPAFSYFCFALADVCDKCGKHIQASNLYALGLTQFPYGRAYMRLAHDLEILNAAPDAQILSLYSQAVIMSPTDKEVKAKYLRMRSRMPAAEKDIARKMKQNLRIIQFRVSAH